jgi:hypothetical protein
MRDVSDCESGVVDTHEVLPDFLDCTSEQNNSERYNGSVPACWRHIGYLLDARCCQHLRDH